MQPKQKSGFFSWISTKLVPVGVGLLVFAAGYGLGSGDVSLGNLLHRNQSLNEQLPANLDYSEVEQIYDSLKQNYAGELDAKKLLNGLKEGLAEASGDPYTEFLDEEEVADFEEDLTGTFSGIGAELSKKDETIVVVAPLSGYPAEKAGLRAQDVISEINGESAFNLSINEAVKKIRGEAGTIVKLKVIRDSSQELDFEIERQAITIPSVESEIVEGNIGYMRISRFAEDTERLTRLAAANFKSAKVKGVILDLRNNPGGLLDTSVSVSSLWLDSGSKVVEEKRGDVVVKTFRADGNAVLAGIPTVVLINQGSASASEIVAGALKDNRAATLMGDKTFGKGSVQQLIDFNNGTQLKVTIARWYTPNGKNIDQEGLEADKKVEVTEADIEADRDPQRQAAIEFLSQ